MRPSKASFVSACQQLLALGAVFAVLAPAANVVSLEVITVLPREAGPGGSEVPGARGVPVPAASLQGLANHDLDTVRAAAREGTPRDRDFQPDLVVRGEGPGVFWVLPGKVLGFGAPWILAAGLQGYDGID